MASRGPTLDSLPDEIMLKIIKMTAGSLVQQSWRGNFLWMNSPGVPKWFRSRFRGHCCYKYRAPMVYHENACEYQHDFIAEVISKISARFNRLARDPSLWRDDMSRSKLKHFACHGSPTLGSLPDKIIVKIVKMAASLRETRDIQERVPFGYEYDHDFVIEVVAKISKRFGKIAAHPDFWQGNVFIYRSSVKINELIQEYLCDATKGLWVSKNYLTVPLQDRSIVALTRKCPDMRQLAFSMSRMSRPLQRTRWPEFDQPWESLEELYLHCFIPRGMFSVVELHQSLPNLRVLSLKGGEYSSPTMLPDMGGCDKMQRLQLSEGYFCIPAVSVFPRELKSLVLKTAHFMAHPGYNLSHENVLEDIKDHMTDCRVVKELSSLN